MGDFRTDQFGNLLLFQLVILQHRLESDPAFVEALSISYQSHKLEVLISFADQLDHHFSHTVKIIRKHGIRLKGRILMIHHNYGNFQLFDV
ncbi:hypothetical protein D3C73_1480560 [compost metagenome]